MDRVDSKQKRRTQRDYTIGFKLQVVAALEQGYKQVQKVYVMQGRSAVLKRLNKHGKLDWAQLVRLTIPKTSKAKETPAQTNKRLERELEDERLRNLLLNDVADKLDAEHGAGLRKNIFQGARRL
ncbi:MAG: hypothetical protein JRE63_02010 [Deltaproteobacteria bacterium]|jgi:hypothetical protein|nr:hypothetical protein [Deltaproteobacteria bacterium]